MEANISVLSSVGETVALDYRTAEVFKKYGIDFCCGGGRSIESACQKAKIEVGPVLEDLSETTASTGPVQNYKDWAADFTADYIVNVHHSYVSKNIPLLLQYTEKVATVHGEGNPHLVEIAALFGEIASELQQHMEDEEQILFPYIREMCAAERSKEMLGNPAFGTVKNPVTQMVHEHDSAGKVLAKIQELTDNFNPPPQACNTWRLSYAKLKEFQDDLHLHIHLENNILFPAALEMENRLNTDNQ